ncbi:MAG: type IV pilin-like G/H family protein [Leptolyngbyaceae cyanobacterium bins.302]|nr:type IV pilin-like G/H family protein [Leptolyngbyaceae cyanobacterium bins.302]
MHKIRFLLPALIALTLASVGCSAEVKTPKTATVSMEVEAREAIGSILFDQKAYYIGNQAFTTSVRNLPAVSSAMESPNYSYKIKAKPDTRKGIAVTATSKHPNLRSFTGVVFVLDAGKEKLTVSEICETTQPSKDAPNPPAVPKRPSEQIRCPVGSRSALSVLALQ